MFQTVVNSLRTNGFVGTAQRATTFLKRRSSIHFGKYFNYGQNIYDRDWDILIILDACRYDLFEEFAPNHSVYQLFDSVEPVYSEASATREWLDKSFDKGPTEDVSETHYVTKTSFSQGIRRSRLFEIEDVWEFAIDPESGVTKSEAVLNEGIRAIRSSDASRYVLHFAPPHAPFLHCLGKYDSKVEGRGNTQNAWALLKAGEVSRDEVWEDYGTNLLSVLDYVEILIKDVSGKVVVSSDHGNALGEWGFYGHPPYAPVPAIKRVPWAVAKGRGENSYEVLPKTEFESETSVTADDQLRALGYL